MTSDKIDENVIDEFNKFRSRLKITDFYNTCQPEEMLFLILFITVVLLVYYVWSHLQRNSQYWRQRGVKGPKPVILFGNMWPLVAKTTSRAEFIQNLYNAFPHERYCGVFQFTTPILLLLDPDLIAQVTVKNFDNFMDHTSALTIKSDTLWSNNLMASKGTQWRNLRHTLSPAFTGSKMRTMFVLMDECATQLVDYVKAQNKEVLEVDMKDICARYAIDLTATTVFGIQVDSLKFQDNEFYANGRDLVNFSGLKRLKFLLYGYFPIISKLFQLKIINSQVAKYFTSVVNKTIKAREEHNILRQDLIQLLLEARKDRLQHDQYNDSADKDIEYASVQEAPTTGLSKSLYLTDKDIVSQAIIFLIGGFETTSSFIPLLCYELAVNPQIQDKLRREILSAREQCAGKITYEELKKIKYLDMVVCEALRKWPATVWLGRTCTKSFVIAPTRPGETPVQINAGDEIWFPVYPLHRDPKYFPNPDLFDPDRFSDENKSKIASNTYLPFGSGPRNCIGNRFGLIMVKIFLFHVLSNFEIIPSYRTQIPLKLSKNSFGNVAEKGSYLTLKHLS